MRVQADQKQNRRRPGLGTLLAPVCVVALLGAALATSRATQSAAPDLIAAPGEQVHYLPFDADQFLTTLRGQHGGATNVDEPVHLVSSIVSARAGNTVAIDHWEDGYDADPVNSPGATTEVTVMAEGQTRVLTSDVVIANIGDITPGGSSQAYFDGRDKIVSTAPVVVTAGGWPSTALTLHAGASAVPEVSRYGYDFVSPVGEDTPFPALSPTASLWEYTGLFVTASQDNTTVTVAGGAPMTLDEGEPALVDGGVNVGDAIHADKPIAVYLSTGDQNVNYEGRLFELTPTERWTDEYFSPVTSTDAVSEVTRVFLYNPGAGAINVGYTLSDATTGTIPVPAGGQANYTVPVDLGVKFSSPGNPFYALQAITTPESGTHPPGSTSNDQSSAYNWGFSLIPERYLTPMVVLGYAPGSAGSENDSAVWVSPAADTTIYVDLDADTTTGALTDPNGNKYDFSCDVTALTPRLLKDDGTNVCYTASSFTNSHAGGDSDMTGARIYTSDGTPLAAAWGQVPGLNSGSPAIDMGTTVLPFPTVDLNKTSEIVNDDGDGLADPGETIRYTIAATNAGITPVDALVLTDEVPDNTSYVLGSTIHDGIPIPDDGSGTAFPLDGAGATLPPALSVGQTRTVTFDVVVDNPLADGVTQIVNEATLATSYGTYTAVDVQPTAPPEPSIAVAKTVYLGHNGGASCEGADAISALNGDDVTYCFAVTNDGTATLAPVTLDDADLGIDQTDVTTVSGDLSSLAPGGTAVVYYETTVDGDLTNTASVTGASVDGSGDPIPGLDPVTADDTAQVDEVAPAVSLAKTVYRGHDSGALCDGAESVVGVSGDEVTYCFTVTNGGDTTLAPVTFADADLGIDESDLTALSGDLALLAPGDSTELYFETTIDGDLTNTASVSGTPADANGAPLAGLDPVTADDTASVDQVAPAVSVAKTVYRDHDDGASCAGAESVAGLNGDAVTYCFTVTNDGDTTLAPVTVADADLGIDGTDMTLLTGSLASLDPSESATLYFETVLDGDLTNTATVSGTPVDGGGDPLPVPVVTNDDTAQVDAVGPAVLVAKTVYRGHDSGASCEGGESVAGHNGDDVTFCFAVTNNGDTTLDPVTVADADLGIDEGDMTVLSGSLSSLAAGDTVVLYFETTIDGDLTNTATATGTPVDGGGDPIPGVDPVDDDDTASVDEVAPAVSVAKTVYRGHDSGAGCPGGELVRHTNATAVTYCFAVTNEGDTDLSPVSVVDLDLGIDQGDMTVLSGSLASLAPGDTAVLSYETTIDGDLTNTATVTGTPVDGTGRPLDGVDDVTADDTAQVDEVGPAVSVAKTVYAGHDNGGSCPGNELVSGAQGADVTYCFVVTNEGDTTLAPVTLDDAALGVDQTDLTVASGSGDLASLAPGDSATLYFQTVLDGDLTNTASVSGTPVDGNGDPIPGVDDVTADDTADVDEVTPSVTVDKTVYRGHDAGASCAGSDVVTGVNGDAVTYCFVVTNNGGATLAPVTLDDGDLGIDDGDLTVASGSLASLSPGDSATLFYETTVDGDLTNTASVTGTPVDGNGGPLPAGQDVTDTDTAQVDEVAPAVSVAKTVYSGHDNGASCPGAELVSGGNGTGVTYCFAVTNDGDTTLDPVTVVDNDLLIDEGDMTVLSSSLASLASGDTAVLYYETTIDGDLTNTATATGTPVDGAGAPYPGLDPVTGDDTAQVAEVSPAISVAKTVYRGHDSGVGCAGGELVRGATGAAVTYCFVVTNDGDTALSPVTVTDADLGVDDTDMTLLSGSLASLDPGDSVTLYFQGVIDRDLVNTATATGTPADAGGNPIPGVSPVTADDTAEVDDVSPSVSVDKTVYRGHDVGAGCAGSDLVSGLSGDPVTYCFTVTNDSDADLSPVTLADGDLGIDQSDMTLLSGSLSTLVQGASATLYYETTIDGDLTNTVTATGSPVDGNGGPLPGGQDVTDTDTAQVDEVAPAVSVDKTVYRGHDAGAGCAGSDLVSGLSGDAVTYCFTVTNDGDTTLAPVTFADADLAIDQSDLSVLSGDLALLAPGGSAELYFETTIDGDLTNTASVSGTPADANGDPLAGLAAVTADDTAQVDEVAPAVSVAKTVYAGHDAGASCAGSELVEGTDGAAVTYCFVVTNEGDTTLAPVALADADLGVDDTDMTVLSGSLASLDPGDSATLYFDTVIDGDLTNTATVTGTPVDGGGNPLAGVDDVTADDTAAVDSVSPSVSVAKTVYLGHDDGAGCAGAETVAGLNGDDVTYCFVVTNDGESTLSPVALADADLGIDDADMTVLSGSLDPLDPGDSATLYYEATIDGDLTNTVTATGSPVDGGGDPLPGVSPVTADDTAEVDEVAPAITVDKTVYRDHDGGAGCPGSEQIMAVHDADVTYCFGVTNHGDTALAPVTVADADLAIDETDMTVVSGDLASLAPGDSVVLYYEATVDGDLTNTATAAGTPVDDGGDPLPGADDVSDDDTAEVDEVAPEMTILTEVLDPFTGNYLDADGDAATLGSNDPTPATLRSGDTASFRFTVSNTGDALITDVVVDAPECDAPPALVSGDDVNPGVLDVDEVWVLSCDVADLTAGMTMTATVTGVSAGAEPEGNDDSETARVQIASISIEKLVQDPATGDFVDAATIETGGDATFQIVVTNTGEVPLSGVSVSDLAAPDCDHDFVDTLDPGDPFASYTCVVTEVDAGFVNTATATGTPVSDGGDPTGEDVTDDDVATVEVEGPAVTDLSITKDLIDVNESAGTATWQVVVTNEGDSPATEPITVTDDLPAELSFRDAGGEGWACDFLDPTVTCVTDTDMAPGESSSFTIETYVEYSPGATITNVAHADGPDDTNPDNNTDDAAVDVNNQGQPVMPTSPSSLPRTGADIAGLLALAGGLILGGVTIRRHAKRRLTT